MASDVASQGGGAGPGLDRHRRARSAVRAGWRGGPSPGTASGHLGEARRNVAKGRGNRGPRPEKRGSSEDILEFLVRISASFADRQVRQWASLDGEDCTGAISALQKGSFRSPALQNVALLHNRLFMDLGASPPH
jgi:hypothetical protein